MWALSKLRMPDYSEDSEHIFESAMESIEGLDSRNAAILLYAGAILDIASLDDCQMLLDRMIE